MSAVLKLFPALPPVDRDAVLRYARGKHTDEIDALLLPIEEEAAGATDARLCYVEVPVTISGTTVDFSVCRAESAALCDHLAGCPRAVLFAATVGAGADRMIARAGRSSPLRALLLDALFTERIEALCDVFTSRYTEKHRRFSPGYGDLPLAFQKDLFRVLDCPRVIGLSLSDALLMIPSKSVTAIIGIPPKQTTPLS